MADRRRTSRAWAEDRARGGSGTVASQPPVALSLAAALEALLFVAGQPVEVGELARALDLDDAAVRQHLAELEAALLGRGLRLQRHGEQVQLVTAPEAGAIIERFLGGRGEARLSQAALETLAIIAYKQPVTRAQVEAIRGVDCGRALATLRARELIEEVGRADGPGRPALYGTTMRFLEYFGLRHPGELPPLSAASEGEGEGAR
jgi:segregation and condensation protein B